ncbi:MAG TPA: DUF2809 domain-containing protein [Salinimicrobium sp.]|nr:DUF2809 domain-containing protein [Salinimicrobium sp.]
MKINNTYLFLSILLLLIEISIALFVHDNFIRPYFGDFLVVILIYCSLKSFIPISPGKAAFLVTIFALLVEFLQYLNFVALIGLQDSKIANVILGNSFAWLDIFCYLAGILFILLVENIFSRRRSEKLTF